MKTSLSLGLLCSALVGLLWWQYGRNQDLHSQLKQSQQATLVAQAQTQALQQRFQAYQDLAEQVAAELRAVLSQGAAIQTQLQKVYQHDDQAKDWADQPVPAGISRLLQPETAAD